VIDVSTSTIQTGSNLHPVSNLDAIHSMITNHLTNLLSVAFELPVENLSLPDGQN
jgi:hypothetical protein